VAAPSPSRFRSRWARGAVAHSPPRFATTTLIWSDPRHLACAPSGPNSVVDEQGPSYVQGRLYFSRSSAVVPGDLYVSPRNGRMSFGAATPITELNDAGANDIQPNVRKDGREIVFSSNRAGGLGGQDIWSATRASVDDPWANLVNLGPNVNTDLGESRPHSRGTRSSFSSAEPAQRERARVEPACPTST
jgi:Tol biopolymer transport system component